MAVICYELIASLGSTFIGHSLTRLNLENVLYDCVQLKMCNVGPGVTFLGLITNWRNKRSETTHLMLWCYAKYGLMQRATIFKQHDVPRDSKLCEIFFCLNKLCEFFFWSRISSVNLKEPNFLIEKCMLLIQRSRLRMLHAQLILVEH